MSNPPDQHHEDDCDNEGDDANDDEDYDEDDDDTETVDRGRVRMTMTRMTRMTVTMMMMTMTIMMSIPGQTAQKRGQVGPWPCATLADLSRLRSPACHGGGRSVRPGSGSR